MKKIGIYMNILMGATMSLFLSLSRSLTSMRQSGEFSLPGFFSGFLIGFAVGLLIGFAVPIPRLTAALLKKTGQTRGTLPARALESLVSDLIYTPAITVVMILLVRSRIPERTRPPFIGMLMGSLFLFLALAFLLIFLFMPLYLRILTKKFGPPGDMPPENGAHPKHP